MTMPAETAAFLDAHQRRTVAATLARVGDDLPGSARPDALDVLDRHLAERHAIDRPRYAQAVAELDRLGLRHFDAEFAELDPGRQDRVLAALPRGSAPDLAVLLRRHAWECLS